MNPSHEEELARAQFAQDMLASIQDNGPFEEEPTGLEEPFLDEVFDIPEPPDLDGFYEEDGYGDVYEYSPDFE